jgi:Right handed beta helix region
MFKHKTPTLLAATALAAGVAFIAAGPSAGSASLPVTSCGQTVTTNAVLTQDLTCAQAGIFVGASGITIDLQGHVLSGDKVHAGIYDNGYDNVTIKNGVVRQFAPGVYAPISGTNNLTISNVVLSGNASVGAFIEGNSTSIVSSTVTGNVEEGIYLVGNSASVKTSTFSGNGKSGVYVSGGTASIMTSTATGNGSRGVWINGNGTSIKSSSAMGNVSSGFELTGDSVTVTSSTASGNASVGLFVGGNSASVKSSKSTGNADDGIRVSGDDATLSGNQANGNGFPGGVSDGFGLGIVVNSFTTAPTGTNTARGNDDPLNCSPAGLC